MQLSALLKGLKGLKLQIEESILLAESRTEGHVDDKLIGLIDQCKECLSAIWFTVHGPPVIKAEHSDTDIDDGELEQGYNDHDNLDDIEFDDIYHNKSEKSETQGPNATSSENNNASVSEQPVSNL